MTKPKEEVKGATITFRLTKREHRTIKAKAKAYGLTISQFLLRLVEEATDLPRTFTTSQLEERLEIKPGTLEATYKQIVNIRDPQDIAAKAKLLSEADPEGLEWRYNGTNEQGEAIWRNNYSKPTGYKYGTKALSELLDPNHTPEEEEMSYNENSFVTEESTEEAKAAKNQTTTFNSKSSIAYNTDSELTKNPPLINTVGLGGSLYRTKLSKSAKR